MDTKFWGPDGWRLLHTITYLYPEKPTLEIKKLYKEFFNALKDILPCRYCRASFNQYIHELPIEPALSSTKKLRLWLYRIHNKVNNKLRKQGLLTTENPTLAYVDSIYIGNLDMNLEDIIGWDFIYSIIYNYSPYGNIDPQIYKTWFNLLGDIAPNPYYRSLFKKQPPITTVLSNASDLQHWYFNFQRNFLKANHYPCPSFKKTCDYYNIAKVQSCSDNKNSKKQLEEPKIPTCRRSVSP
jgi:hypothetical protein